MATASVTSVEARADGRAALASAQTTVRGPPDAAAPSRPVDGASADAIPATSASATGEDAEALAALLPPTDRALGDDLAWLVDRRVLSLPLGIWSMPAERVRARLRDATPGLTGRRPAHLSPQRAIGISKPACKPRSGRRHRGAQSPDVRPGGCPLAAGD